MGYFDGLTNASFKKDENGNTVFFPWGVFGKGRVLDESTEARVRRFVSLYYKISLPLIVGVGVIVGWLWALPLVVFLLVWFYLTTKSLVSGCPYSEGKLTLKESYISSAAGYSRFTLWLLLACSALFVAAGIFIAAVGGSTGKVVLGLLTAVFFGACGVGIGYMLKLKKR
jgi:hypothetical protein